MFIVKFTGVCFCTFYSYFCGLLLSFRNQLGLHRKPIGMINVANYFGGFLDWVSTFTHQYLFLF